MEALLEKLASRTWPWMVGAFVLVAGFMYWLYVASAGESGPTAANLVPDSLPRVAADSFAIAPERYSRRRVLLPTVKIAQQLGRATFSLDLPNRPGYPVILDRPVLEKGLQVVPGDNISIAGSVYALNDSILDVYAQRGFFEVGQREKLEAHTTFFLVDSMELVIPDDTGSP